jgi:hypothetical protein
VVAVRHEKRFRSRPYLDLDLAPALEAAEVVIRSGHPWIIYGDSEQNNRGSRVLRIGGEQFTAALGMAHVLNETKCRISQSM